MILILEEPSSTVELQEQVITVFEVADFNAPSGINESVFTAEGQLIISLAADTPTVLDNPGVSGMVLTANTTVAGKIEWAAVAAGGASIIETQVFS